MTAANTDAQAIGRAIYDEKIRGKMQPEDKGKLVVIDIHSGDYEADHDDAAALFRLLARRPGAFTWAERVGYPTPYVKGDHLERSDTATRFQND